jgi:unsaturated rhamnogalacturonyl hydrolase
VQLAKAALWIQVIALAAGAERVPAGITAGGAPIEAWSVTAGKVDAPKIILVGDSKTVRQEIQKYESLAEPRRKFDVMAVVLPGNAKLVFPPTGDAYRDLPESHSIWRWIGLQAPDLVLVEGDDSTGLAAALSQNVVAGVGRIPARSGSLGSVKATPASSEAHTQMAGRVARPTRQVAEELARVYGRELPEVAYIPAIALIARLRLGELAEVEKIAAPYREGAPTLDKAVESTLAGHLLFAELAEQTGDPRYKELVRNAADLASHETLHNEMSDSVFMSCPILAKAGKLTGETKYFDSAARHLELMQKLCLRQDGLYRHSPLNDAAWARGNAFAALGLALTLADMPKDHPAYEDMVRSFQNHMSALARFQDENGMWREVMDRAGAYSELSATAMIGTAMLRGIRGTWLDPKAYRPRLERAWRAVSARTSSDGVLIDVCESTGKQKSADDYLWRTAVFGRDSRGGAMVMLFATEMAGLR